MEHYLLTWLHAYIMHFGMWVSLVAVFALYKDGLPKLKHLREMFTTILIISLVMAAFSSHSQTHLIEQFLTK